MNDIKRLHREAMAALDQALERKVRGELEAYKDLTHSALVLETSAAEQSSEEPTRSVLFRSSASIALELEDWRRAEVLACVGLAGSPPEDIARDLRTLLEKSQFAHHLQSQRLVMSDTLIRMSLMSGEEVGYGYAEAGEVLRRAQGFHSLLSRSVDRKLNLPFRERGRMKKADSRPIIYFEAMEAASFAITLRVSEPAKFEAFKFGPEIARDFVESCKLLLRSPQALKDVIREDAYRRNFVGLLKSIAPDGERVRAIGFTAASPGWREIVVLDTPKGEMPKGADIAPVGEEWERRDIEGILKMADDRYEHSSTIGIQGDGRKIRVPEGMMEDIVRPHWGRKVHITAKARGKELVLVDIDPLEDQED